MALIHSSALYLHIAAGAIALLLFWIPVFARKGGFNHRRFGRYFSIIMYTVSVSGLTMGGLDLVAPLGAHAAGLELSPAEAESISRRVRSSALFLFSLSILVLTTTRQGWLAILGKHDRSALRSPLHTLLCASLIVVGIALGLNGYSQGSVLYMIFGGLEIFLGVSSLHYNFKHNLAEKEWWIEHLGGLIGAGIGAYTAFFVFGGSSLFGNVFSDYSIVLWITPGVVGAMSIGVLTRHYRRRFAIRNAHRLDDQRGQSTLI